MTSDSPNLPVSNPGLDAALQPQEPNRDQSGPPPPAVEPTLSGDQVARQEAPEARVLLPTDPSTHMTRSPEFGEEADAGTTRRFGTGEEAAAWEQVNALTNQQGVGEGRSHDPEQTPLSGEGVPGQGKERNLPSVDLYANRHPDGDPFGSQEQTIGRPLAPGEPSAAGRSLPLTAGEPVPDSARPQDVPRGSASRPEPTGGHRSDAPRDS
jgi:hypothetical protein